MLRKAAYATCQLTDEDLPDLDLDEIPDCLDPDKDGDGFQEGADCNDEDVMVHPGATETCNGKDDDCNGTTDELGIAGCTTYYLDADEDDYGVQADSVCACGPTGAYKAKVPGDCDDKNKAVNPGASEICDGLDNDCDNVGDTPGLPGCVPWYVDADQDGHGHPAKWKCLCGPEGQYLTQKGDDCDDTTELTWPGAPEVCDLQDNDCDGRIDIPLSASPECPADCAGKADCAAKCAVKVDCSTDCGPGQAACLSGDTSGCTAPKTTTCLDPKLGCSTYETCGACPAMPPELCNLADDDCDGLIDEGVLQTVFVDADEDGHGKPGSGKEGCAGAPKTSLLDDDCNDADATVHPGADEVCDKADQDCDFEIDEGVLVVYWTDQDGDGYGDPAKPVSACEAPAGAVIEPGDCAPEVATVHPNADELCNGKDDDCDGQVDESWPTLGQPCDGLDTDPCPDGTVVCAPGQADTICEDPENALVEKCNGVDDNCDGQIDELWPTLGDACDGEDADSCAEGQIACDGSGTGVVCAELGNGHEESCNTKDDDCDGLTDELWPDLGGACDGPDPDQCATGVVVCADTGASTICKEEGPGVQEICNGQDDDCDGEVDELWPELKQPCDGPDADQCKLGVTVCDEGGAGVTCKELGPPKVDVCNGQDDDCDGVADEDFPDKGKACDGPDADQCKDGKLVCNGVDLVCDDDIAAVAELCNGQDDTCDGVVDEGFETQGTPCDGPDGDQCKEGVWQCNGVGLECSDTTDTLVEQCNNQDDDCDGKFDEDVPNMGQPCTVPGVSGVCKQGQTVCQSGTIQCQQTQFGGTEICNGQDDDCDGQVDGIIQDCSNSCGSGTKTCYGGSWGGCSAPTPQCTSGACCDGCHFEPASTQCGGPDQTVSECQGTCGGGIVQKKRYRYCTGYSSDCGTGNQQWISQGVVSNCSSGQLCQESGSSASCASCSCGCSGGQCITNNQYAKKCVSGDVWWTDCNGTQTSKVEECGSCSCQGSSCSVTTTSNKVCSGGNVYYTDCKGNVASLAQTCCGGCSSGKCKTTSTVTVDQADSGFSKYGSTYWWTAYTHTDGSADGWFNTNAYGSQERFYYTFGGGSGNTYYGIFQTSGSLTGTYNVRVHQPSPDPFDPSMGGAGPNSFVKCSTVHFTIKHKGSTSGQAVTKSMNASGWVTLGTFEFCGQKGYVRYGDNASPSNCAVSFDAVRWELK